MNARTAGVDVPADDEFAALVDPHRRELLAHCYRMTGSLHDAEDLVQETLLRAWRSYGTFEGRSSLRTWLYRIATNVCLTALQHRSRRVLPSGLGAPSADPEGALSPRQPEDLWLQPVPDSLLGWDTAADPATIVARRASMRLAVIAAMQRLPAKQRAALILRDVLDLPSDEIADVLGTSVAAANSALQRARASLAERPVDEDALTVSPDVDEHVLGAYIEAFEAGDAAAIARLLHDDIVLEMPPIPDWFIGREAVARFFETKVLHGRLRHFQPTRANGQPAAVTYVADGFGGSTAHSVQVLTVADGRLKHLHVFLSPSLLPSFGFPATRSD